MASISKSQSFRGPITEIDFGDLSWLSEQEFSDKSYQQVFRDFGIDLSKYHQLQFNIDLLRIEYKKIISQSRGIRAQLLDVQQCYKVLDYQIQKFNQEMRQLEQQILNLKEKEFFAKQECIKSQAALDKNPNPGKKPEEKRAAQKWRDKMEAYQKIAPGLRQTHEKNQNALALATQTLKESEGRLACLREQHLRTQQNQSFKRKMEPILAELAGLETKMQNLKSAKEDLLNEFLLTIVLEPVKKEVRNEIEKAFPFD